jgi:hypothetical protein
VELRRCRGGCGADETVCHILQACPVAHHSRVRRHNAVATKIATQCRRDGKEVLEEPHVRHRDGTLYKPDLVVFRSPDDAVVCDVQISWEVGSSSTQVWHRKREVYDNTKFLEAARRRWPGVAFEFLPLVVGARGVWPACNHPTSRALGIHPDLRRACVASVLKWGCSAHRSFMSAGVEEWCHRAIPEGRSTLTLLWTGRRASTAASPSRPSGGGNVSYLIPIFSFHMHYIFIILYCNIVLYYIYSLTACTASLYQQNPGFV